MQHPNYETTIAMRKGKNVTKSNTMDLPKICYVRIEDERLYSTVRWQVLPQSLSVKEHLGKRMCVFWTPKLARNAPVNERRKPYSQTKWLWYSNLLDILLKTNVESRTPKRNDCDAPEERMCLCELAHKASYKICSKRMCYQVLEKDAVVIVKRLRERPGL
jgi:hypothetical protein